MLQKRKREHICLSAAQAYGKTIRAMQACNTPRTSNLIMKSIFGAPYNSHCELVKVFGYQSQFDGFWRFAAPFSFSRSS